MKDVGFLRILPRQIVLMNVSLEQLLSLSYIEQFLFRKDISHLKQIRSIIERKIMPAITAQSNYQNTFNYMQKIEKNMFEVSSSTVDHSAMLQKIVQINIAVFRNIFGFAMLNFLAIGYLLGYQRYAFIRRREQFLIILLSFRPYNTISCLSLASFP